MTDARDPQVDEPTAEEEDVPLGPTGRPLHPIGAYFEAAFRRFGINFLGYLVYTVACGLLPIGAAIAVPRMGLSGEVQGILLSAAYVLGLEFLVALTTVLVAGGTRDRLPGIVVACVATAIPATFLLWQLLFVAVVFLPFFLFPPIIAASGDASGLAAVWMGVTRTFRWFRRTYACVFGLIIVAVGLWFGFTGLLFAVPGTLGEQLRLALSTLFMWPIAALVFRNLYGDMTGRLVINAAPKENEYRKDIMRRRRERAKRNKRRLDRIRGRGDGTG